MVLSLLSLVSWLSLELVYWRIKALISFNIWLRWTLIVSDHQPSVLLIILYWAIVKRCQDWWLMRSHSLQLLRTGHYNGILWEVKGMRRYPSDIVVILGFLKFFEGRTTAGCFSVSTKGIRCFSWKASKLNQRGEYQGMKGGWRGEFDTIMHCKIELRQFGIEILNCQRARRI